MSLEAKFRLSVDGKDELSSFLGRSQSSLKSFSSTVSNEMRSAARDVATFAGSAMRGLGALGGIGAGVGIAEQAKTVVELRDAVAGLAATAGLGQDSLGGLKSQILQTSEATHQFGTDLTEALNAFVAKTGDIETGRKNLELYGKTATAARAGVADIANIGADLGKLKITDQANALAILAKQADIGTVELKDMVSQGPRVLAAFAGAGLTGEQGLRRGGALFQVVRSATGSSEMATTVTERMLADVVQKQRLVEGGLGVQVFNPKTHQANDRIQVILDVVAKSGGREDVLREIFGEESIRGALALATDFKRTGGFGDFSKFAGVDADAGLIQRKFDLNTGTAAGKFKQAQIRTQRSADANLGDHIESIADHAGAGAQLFDFVTAHPLLAAGGGFAGLVGKGLAARGIGSLASRAGRALLGGKGGKVGGAIAEMAGGAGGSSEGVQRVYVVNLGSGGLLGDTSSSSSTTKALGDGIGGKVADAVKTAGGGFLRQEAGAALTAGGGTLLLSAAAVAAAGVVGFKVGQAIDKAFDVSGHLTGMKGADDDNGGAGAKSAAQRRSEGKEATSIQERDNGEDFFRYHAAQEQMDVARNIGKRLATARWLAEHGHKTTYDEHSAVKEFDAFTKVSGGKAGQGGGRGSELVETLRGALLSPRAEDLEHLTGRRLDLLLADRRSGKLPGAVDTTAPEQSLIGPMPAPPTFGAQAASILGIHPEQILAQFETLKEAFSPEAIAKEMNLNLVVNINGDEAEVKSEGTRSAKAMVKRGAR